MKEMIENIKSDKKKLKIVIGGVIAAIIIIILIILLTVGVLNKKDSPNKKVEEAMTAMAKDFYENFYYPNLEGGNEAKRTDFLRMISDATDNKIDLILTKSISRFARNTLDTLKYVRLLKEKNVGIIFEEENINTLEMTGELLLTILSSVAQQESENISEHVKLGLKMRKEKGEKQ